MAELYGANLLRQQNGNTLGLFFLAGPIPLGNQSFSTSI